MRCLIVIAHPLAESLCHRLAQTAIETLRDLGHDIQVIDLYQQDFAPALTMAERQSYYEGAFAAQAVQPQVEQLLWAEALVLVFPTWWFGFPAILKGWFDRVWAPGVAYDHASDFGPIRPRLAALKRVLAITTLGAAWWVDWLVLWRPVQRILKLAILGACAPSCRLQMLSCYKAETLSPQKVAGFQQRIRAKLAGWAQP